MNKTINEDRRIEILDEPDDYCGRSVGIRLWLNEIQTTVMWLNPSEARDLVAALRKIPA
jgi:hypothetical protein